MKESDGIQYRAPFRAADPGHAFGSDSRQVATQSFQYPSDETAQAIQRELAMDMAAQVLRKVFSWVWQNGYHDPRGLRIRASTVCWKVLPELRSLSMAEISRNTGRHKQSLGRWVDDLHRKIPELK